MSVERMDQQRMVHTALKMLADGLERRGVHCELVRKPEPGAMWHYVMLDPRDKSRSLDTFIARHVAPAMRVLADCVEESGLAVSVAEMRPENMPAGGSYYYCTGLGISLLYSEDLKGQGCFRIIVQPAPPGIAEPVPVRATPPSFAGPTCRGSYKLGSACGHCERCDWERFTVI